MKLFNKLVLILLYSSSLVFAVDYLHEDFSTSDKFVSNTSFFSDSLNSSGYDFFGISDGNGGGNFGNGVISKTKVKNYSGFNSNFLTGMDLDGEGANLPIVISWSNIDILGAKKLYFSGKFAEYLDSKLSIDRDDFIRVEVQIDGGEWNNLLEFRGDKEYNGEFIFDNNKLNSNAQLFQVLLPNIGSTLNLKISLSVNSSNEDFAISDIKISDTSIKGCTDTNQVVLCSEKEDNDINSTTQNNFISIHDIQSNVAISPFDKKQVSVNGIVTSVLPNLKGFYLQQRDENVDLDEKTSEGIFIYCASNDCNVSIGDNVSLDGKVSEYYKNTQIKNISNLKILSKNNPLPLPKIISFPVQDKDFWESVEGMVVNIPQTLTVTDTYHLGRYGEILLSAKGKIYQYTHNNSPSASGYSEYLEDFSKNTIKIDDGSNVQNPNIVIFPNPALSHDNVLRAGDTTEDLTGVVTYSFNEYKIVPTKTINFTALNPRADLEYIDSRLKIAGFNVLNLFLSIDDGTLKCGANKNLNCRGADSHEELVRQTEKLVNALSLIDADIVGLNELENTKDVKVLEYLVNSLNDKIGQDTYKFIDTDTIGNDAIKVGIIYKSATVEPLGDFAILDSKVDKNFIDSKNRPSLAQTFKEISSNEKFTIVVNHLKSKGSSCDDVNDPDKTDGQDSCVETRTKALKALHDWLKTDPTNSNDSDYMILGDFNSYAKEKPIVTFEQNGYINLVNRYLNNDAYSYSYKGKWGYLDYAFASKSLQSQVKGLVFWHINSDETPAFDYNDYNQKNLYSANQYRNSDHDPIIVGLDLYQNSETNSSSSENNDSNVENNTSNSETNSSSQDNEDDLESLAKALDNFFEAVKKALIEFIKFLANLFLFL